MSRQNAAIACLIAAPAIIGGSVAVAAVLRDYPVSGGQAARYAIGTLLLVLFMKLRRTRWVPMTGKDVLMAGLVAALGLVAFNICLIESARRLPPSMVGAIVGAAPVIFALAGPLQRRQRPQPALVLAALLVSAGVVLTQGPLGAASLSGVLWAVGALLGEVAFSLLAMGLLARYGALQVSTLTCALAVPELIVLGLLMPGPLFAVPSMAEAGSLVYMAVLATAVAFVLFYTGLDRMGAAVAGLFSGVIPVTALIISVALGQEQLTWYAVTGVAVVSVGIIAGALLPAWIARLRQRSVQLPVVVAHRVASGAAR